MALLLASARARSDAVHAAQVRKLACQGLDWDVLLRQAGRHGLGPLLYWHLQQSCPEVVPAHVLEKLKNDSQANARRSLLLTGELVKILTLLQQEGIPAIPYKGPVLTAALYGNLALREFFDLDILVPRPHALAAKQALVSGGYRPAHAFAPWQEAALFHSGCEFEMESADREFAVEIHWQIVPRHLSITFDMEQLQRRAQRVSLSGMEAPTLAPEDLLLVLSVHAAKHLWQSLAWICDLAELIRLRKDLDWELVRSQARNLGAWRILLISLHLSRELLGADLPREIRDSIEEDRSVRLLTQPLIQAMWATDKSGFAPSKEHAWFLFRARERWSDRARYILRLAFTPGANEWSLLVLPAALAPLYPVIRLGRLAGKLFRELWRHSGSPPPAAAGLDQASDPPRS